MDFRFTPEQEKLRKEIRDFLDKEVPKSPDRMPDDCWIVSYSPEFSRKIGARGWIGTSWPKQFGGKGWSYLDRLILTEELLRYGAPVGAHWMADRQMGPSIIAHGSDELKKEFLPKIIKGECYIAAGMSEPEAGSDLASLKTRAVPDGDDFVINGQKVWTSNAHRSHYIYLVVRTDPNVAKHKGISEILVDTRLKGITVHPLTDSTGSADLNEVFFDNVRVPQRYLVGKLNNGWYQITSQLDYERSGIERLMSNWRLYDDFINYAGKNGILRSPIARNRLAQLAVEFEVGRLMVYRVAWLLSKGVLPNYETAMAKVYCCEYEQRLANTLSDLLGMYGQLNFGSPRAILNGRAGRNFLYCPGYTIMAGGSEILRGIVAMRGLKLPAA